MMEISGDPTLQKLAQAFNQFRKLHWHQKHAGSLKSSELFVLFRIKEVAKSESSGAMISEISRQLKVAPPTVTQLVNGLEASGLVERNMDKEDRRAVRIKLTEKGDNVIKKAEERFTKTFSGLVEYLGEEKSKELANLLEEVFTYFEGLNNFSEED